MIKPLMIMTRALVERIAAEIREFTTTQTSNPMIVHKRQARTLLSTYPSAPRESGFSHQAMAMQSVRTDARFERDAFVVKNQMTGAETKRVRSSPTSQPTAP